MKCYACNRPLNKSAATIGKLSVGPKCLKKMFGAVKKSRKEKAIRREQPELFDFQQMEAA